MADIVVLGAGLGGLSTAMLLANDGHQVTVLERDAGTPSGGADDLWAAWDRPGVGQFRLPHYLQPRWRAVMQQELPSVLVALRTLGGTTVNFVRPMPPQVTGGFRADDERFDTVTARRPVIEAAVVAAAADVDGLQVRRGISVTGLLSDAGDPPRVTGVALADGTTLRADLVVDAMGRRSPGPSMLAALGARPGAEEKAANGFAYYMRHFRAAGGLRPQLRGPALQHHPGLSLLVLPCDGDTWCAGFVVSAKDRAMRGLRESAAWDAAIAPFGVTSYWGGGDPITDVQAFSAIEDRVRRLVVDGVPTVTGYVAVADAWAATNPSLGRGAAIGLLHGVLLRDTLRDVGADDARDLAVRFAERTEATVGLYYRETATFDAHRLAEIEAQIAGETYDPPGLGWSMSQAMAATAGLDPEIFRASISIASLLATAQETTSSPQLRTAVADAMAVAGPTPAGPGRDEVLESLAQHAAA